MKFSQYVFTLDAKFSERPLGEIPSGSRVELCYEGGSAKSDFKSLDKRFYPVDKAISSGPLPSGFPGKLSSGSDWVTVRRDAVAIFSTRLSLRSDGALDATTLSVLLSGVVDLRGGTFEPTLSAQATDEEVFNAWRGDKLKRIDVALFASFEGPDARTPLESSAAMAKSATSTASAKAASRSPSYVPLTRGLCLATGEVVWNGDGGDVLLHFWSQP